MCRGCALISRNIPHPELGSVWLFICLFLVFRRNICTFDPTEKPTVTDNEDREREYSEVRLTTYFWFHRTSTSSWRIKRPLCPSVKSNGMSLRKRLLVSSGLELTYRDNMHSLLCALHLLHITDSPPPYTVPTSQHAVDGTSGMQQFTLRSTSIYDNADNGDEMWDV